VNKRFYNLSKHPLAFAVLKRAKICAKVKDLSKNNGQVQQEMAHLMKSAIEVPSNVYIYAPASNMDLLADGKCLFQVEEITLQPGDVHQLKKSPLFVSITAPQTGCVLVGNTAPRQEVCQLRGGIIFPISSIAFHRSEIRNDTTENMTIALR
jgi:hypothetical protein